MLVLVPSRERPHNVERLAAAASHTMSGAGELLFIFDDDDPRLDDSISAASMHGFRYEVQERLITVPKINRAASRHLDERIIMFVGDDHVPLTMDWDKSITGAIDDLGGTGYAYPWALGRADVPEVCAISSNIVRALGWFGLPAISHYYVDNVWADIGNGARCITFLSDVILEHMHFARGRGPRDHISLLAIEHTAADHQAYMTWRDRQMAADVNTVRSLRAVL